MSAGSSAVADQLDKQVLEWIEHPNQKLYWVSVTDMLPYTSIWTGPDADAKTQAELDERATNTGMPVITDQDGKNWSYHDVESSLGRLTNLGHLHAASLPYGGHRYILSKHEDVIKLDSANWNTPFRPAGWKPQRKSS
jgi:hypothetical protein